jgi:hypothetical protein
MDVRPFNVAKDWSHKFYLTNAVNHKYQSKRAVILAIELMFDALENEQLPYFEHKGKPEFWREFKDYWENARNYLIANERAVDGIGIKDKYPNTNKSETISRVVRGLWDVRPQNDMENRKLRTEKKSKYKVKHKDFKLEE